MERPQDPELSDAIDRLSRLAKKVEDAFADLADVTDAAAEERRDRAQATATASTSSSRRSCRLVHALSLTTTSPSRGRGNTGQAELGGRSGFPFPRSGQAIADVVSTRPRQALAAVFADRASQESLMSLGMERMAPRAIPVTNGLTRTLAPVT